MQHMMNNFLKLFKLMKSSKKSPRISNSNEVPSEIRNCLKHIESTLSELELSVNKSMKYENIITSNTLCKVDESISNGDIDASAEDESTFSNGGCAARHCAVCYRIMFNQLEHQKETLLEKDSQLGDMEDEVKKLQYKVVYYHKVVSELHLKYQRLKKKRMKTCFHKVQVKELLNELQYIREERDNLIDIFLMREKDPQKVAILYEIRRSNTLLYENLHLKHQLNSRENHIT